MARTSDPPGQLDARHFTSARDLLAALDVGSGDWMDERAAFCQWVFRGHADADWRLVPPAWRDDQSAPTAVVGRMRAALQRREFKSPRPLRSEGPQRELLLQGMAEIALVSAFLTLTDDLGIATPGYESVPVPFDLSEPRWLLQARDLANPYVPAQSGSEWNYRGTSFADNPAFALAQHHGMPTRLLDWTRDPMVAAYFAAESAPAGNGNLAVWAVHRETVRHCPWVNLCQVPRNQNEFVHAQSGVFLVHVNEAGHYFEHGRWPDLLDPLLKVGNRPVRKFTLPRGEAGELSRILWRRRVSRAHLMPTHDSVTVALRRQWELLDP